MTHPVFSLPDLEDLELLPAGAQGDLAVDLVVDALGVGQGAAVLPVGPEEAKQANGIDSIRTKRNQSKRCRSKLFSIKLS